MTDPILAQLAALKGAPAPVLKAKWRTLFDTEPPPYNRRFLEHRLAYRIQELAYGSGNMGMVGGQVLDIQAENKDIDLATLQNIHKHKTGMLIRAAVRMGAIAGGAQDRQLDDLTSYAEDVGLAFQIADDVLNVTGTREELGKNPNTDAERGKKTYPTFYGTEGARKLADDCVARATARLSSFAAAADPLRELARYITSRKN